MEAREDVYQQVNYRDLVEELRRFPTLKDLYESEFYRQNQQALFWMLAVPQPTLLPDVEPRVHDFIRVVQWNIEKGKHFDELVEAFSTHPILKYADLIFLNEVDYGMARSGNRHVARDLGAELKMHVAFAPAHLELTKGTGDDLKVEGENRVSLQGNALLSRYSFGQLRLIELPTVFEPFEFEEKRFGRRLALLAEVRVKRETLTAISTHLEVRTTPRGRAVQMGALLERLEGLGWSQYVLLAGDLNTSTFARGTQWRTFRAIAKILLSRPDRMMESLAYPEPHREPLLEMLTERGFSLRAFNSPAPTQSTALKTLDEANHVPQFLQNWVVKKLAQYDNKLEMRLDWIAGRSVKALADNQLRDSKSGIASLSPQVITELNPRGQKVSDHHPIVADVQLEGEPRMG